MHLYDDIGDASSSLRGPTSSLKNCLKKKIYLNELKSQKHAHLLWPKLRMLYWIF